MSLCILPAVGEKKPDVIGIKEDLQELKEKDVEPVGQEYIEEIKSDENDPQGTVILVVFIIFTLN